METLPSTHDFENKIEVLKQIEFEVEVDGQRFMFIFDVKIDVTFDEEADEIVIDCTEQTIDNLH